MRLKADNSKLAILWSIFNKSWTALMTIRAVCAVQSDIQSS